MNKVNLFFKNNSSTILSILGSIGVVATAVLAAKATPKALKAIELEKRYPSTENETISDAIKSGSLTKLEIIKAGWKPYIPSILSGLTTICCIFGSNYINKKNQRALVSAYLLLHNSYLRYRENTMTLYGIEADEKIKSLKRFEEAKNESILNDINSEDDEELYFDCQSMQYFKSNEGIIEEAEYYTNKLLNENGYIYLNDIYDMINAERVDYGYQIGWSTSSNDDLYSKDGIKFIIEKTELDDGLECNILSFSIEPSIDILY